MRGGYCGIDRLNTAYFLFLHLAYICPEFTNLFKLLIKCGR